MKYRVIIVEDEVHQQHTLTEQLNKNFDNLEIVGAAPNVAEASRLLEEAKPDLVFLDVMLGPKTSFELLAGLKSIAFEIIFTTSFEEFAVRAFRLSAVDYLLKPVDEAELIAAVKKFLAKQSVKTASEHLDTLLQNLRTPQSSSHKIALPTLTGYLFIKVADIVRCEADNTYTTFHTSDKRKIVVSKTLKDCELMLSDYGFFRVHNSHLINLDYIQEYIRGEGGMVKMADGASVDVSRRRKDEFIKLWKK